MRISKINSEQEAELEERRESLRDRRWVRHRSMIGTACRWTTVLVVALGINQSWANEIAKRVIGLL